MIVDGRLATVVIPRDAIEGADEPDQAVIQAVVDYVNDIQRAGIYPRHEMPLAAMQVYYADYYLTHVNNGGHGQFIRNAGIAMLPTTAGDALAALQAMGAGAQQQILIEMLGWVKANLDEAAKQSGLSARADILKTLDDRFHAAERERPMTRLAARWIASWPGLRVVGREQYQAEIDRLAQLNPHLTRRRVWQGVHQLRFQMTDPLQITIAAACGAVKPQPEVKLEVRPGVNVEIEGQPCMAFGVGTDKGTRLCVYEKTGGRLYELDRTLGRVAAGAQLSAVGAEMIQQFATSANQMLAAEALLLLLWKAGLDPKAMVTAWEIVDDAVSWIAATGQTHVAATIDTAGALLTKPDQTPIVEVSRADMERIAAEATAGAASLRPPA
jgi:Domain of unknown function (DUF4375)